MQFGRPLIAQNSRRFGRRAVALSIPLEQQRVGMSDDLRLFAATFAAGFLFVSVLIA